MEINQVLEKGLSFPKAVSPLLKLAKIFPLLPIKGNNGISGSTFYYSCQIFYSVIVASIIGMQVGIIIFWMVDSPWIFGKIVILIFYGTNLTIVMLFLRLSRKWPKLMKKWTNVENKLPQYRTIKERYFLGKKIKWIIFSFLLLSFVEHFLSIISGMYHVYHCSLTSVDFYDILEGYMKSNMPQLFHIFPGYSVIKAICIMTFNLYCTFIWNFMDLFIIVISVGLSRKFNQVYISLFRNKNNKCSEFYWRYHRQCYKELVELLEKVDSCISFLVLLSFLSNLFFICIQLFNGLNTQNNVVGGIYFWYSMIFLIGRTFSVAFSAAQIHEESKKPLALVRGVPTEFWNTEISRFSEQLVNDQVALSGNQFFQITRGLILTISGTVVTYELVLIQSESQTTNNLPCK